MTYETRRQSPDESRANPKQDFTPGRNFADIFRQLADLKRAGVSTVHTNSNGEVPIRIMTNAIQESIRQLIDASTRSGLDSQSIDRILANNGVTRAGNLRQSIAEIVGHLLPRAGQHDGLHNEEEAQSLADYLTDQGEHHPLQQMEEAQFRQQYPRDANIADPELRRAVAMRWVKIETTSRQQRQSQREQQRREYREWVEQRGNDVFDAADVSNPVIQNQELYEVLLSNNRGARMKRNQHHGAVMGNIEPFSVPKIIGDILRSHSTSEQDYSFDGINKVRLADGKTKDVMAQTLHLSSPGSEIVVSFLSGAEMAGRGSGQQSEVLEGAAVQSIGEYRFSDLVSLAEEAKKEYPDNPNVSAAFTPDQIKQILAAWQAIHGAEFDVMRQTGVLLGLTQKFHDTFGQLHLPNKPRGGGDNELPPFSGQPARARQRYM